MKLVGVATFVAGLALAGAASAATNLVTNGEFLGTVTPSYQTVDGGNTFIDWTVGGASVDFINGYWQSPPGGGNSVDLDGNAPGSISQDFTTVVGKQYELTFYLSGNPDITGPNSSFTNPTTATVDVTGTGFGTVTYNTQTAGNTLTDMKYVPETFFFNATNTTTDLTFTGTNAGPYGAVIADVSVTAAPEPSTWALMIIGVGMAGGALRLSRKSRGLSFVRAA